MNNKLKFIAEHPGKASKKALQLANKKLNIIAMVAEHGRLTRALEEATRQLTEESTQKDRFYTERQILFDQSNDWRLLLALKFITGDGIEIGPAQHPLAIPHEARVSYVDVMPTEELRKTYKDIPTEALVPIDVVDDAEKLTTFKDRSLNFVIANHFLEHTIDPILTLKTFYRVLGAGGVVFMAIPDKRFTFDIDRKVTPLARLKDFHNDPSKAEEAKWGLFLDCAENIEKIKGRKAQEEWARHMMAINYSIHYNVWTQHDIAELLLHVVRQEGLDFDIEAMVKNGHELIVVLRKEPLQKDKKPKAKAKK